MLVVSLSFYVLRKSSIRSLEKGACFSGGESISSAVPSAGKPQLPMRKGQE